MSFFGLTLSVSHFSSIIAFAESASASLLLQLPQRRRPAVSAEFRSRAPLRPALFCFTGGYLLLDMSEKLASKSWDTPNFKQLPKSEPVHLFG